MELDVSSRARPYFQRAGFDPLRMVPVHSDVPRQHPAYELLSRMDGLHIGVDDDREMLEEVCNDVAFGYTDDPSYSTFHDLVWSCLHSR